MPPAGPPTDPPADGALPPFPPEAGWLELSPPPIGEDFVGRTLARLRDAGAIPRSGRDGDEPQAAPPGGLGPEVLAALRAPAPQPDFVASAFSAVQRDRADRWRRLLLRYEAPAPTADFVGRTLRALARPAATRRVTFRHAAWFGLATAAAVLLLLRLRPERPAYALRTLLVEAPSTAAAHSPAVLSHLLAARREPDAVTPPLAAAAPDGAWLWLATVEARR